MPVCIINLIRRGNNSAVECNLAKVEVAGSNPVSRSNFLFEKIIAGESCPLP